MVSLVVGSGVLVACGGGGGSGTEADRIGIAAQCSKNSDCPEVAREDGGTYDLVCLTQFKGGYCGLEDCEASVDCPTGSICVKHTDNKNYCFRVCKDKIECNANRTADLEANCSSNFDWAMASDDDGSKACIPPSGSL